MRVGDVERILLLGTGAMGGLTASRVLRGEWVPALADGLTLLLLVAVTYVVHRKSTGKQ
jgi:ketopantoate reductase